MARSIDVCERHISHVARQFNIPIGILYSVALTETGRKGALEPFAINVDGAPNYPATMTEAVRIVRDAQRRGASTIDVGCMQINLRYHGANFQTLEQMFEPSRNVAYAGRFLRDLRGREADWTRAVARYHAGANNHPAQRRYICSVVRNLVAAGLGNWTESARTLCQETSAKR